VGGVGGLLALTGIMERVLGGIRVLHGDLLWDAVHHVADQGVVFSICSCIEGTINLAERVLHSTLLRLTEPTVSWTRPYDHYHMCHDMP
jgi:hypothetical protein